MKEEEEEEKKEEEEAQKKKRKNKEEQEEEEEKKTFDISPFNWRSHERTFYDRQGTHRPVGCNEGVDVDVERRRD